MFLVQSDETEFIEFITNKFPNNSFYFNDEIRHMKKCDDTVDKKMSSQNYEFSKKYLAIFSAVGLRTSNGFISFKY